MEWTAAGRPVLLVAEDLHRADPASLQLTTHIGRRLAGLPVMLVLTRRGRPVRTDRLDGEREVITTSLARLAILAKAAATSC